MSSSAAIAVYSIKGGVGKTSFAVNFAWEAALANYPKWPIIPYASADEQMTDRRMPIGAFAASNVAGQGFAALWQAIERIIAEGSK